MNFLWKYLISCFTLTAEAGSLWLVKDWGHSVFYSSAEWTFLFQPVLITNYLTLQPFVIRQSCNPSCHQQNIP